MRWSKLKQSVESRFADESAGRVELRTTRYAKEADQFGRSWITLDGVELVNMSNYLPTTAGIADGDSTRFAQHVFAGYDLSNAMRAFLNLPIDAALASTNPLVRALALLDRRVGRRRLATIDVSADPPWVARMVKLRVEPVAAPT